MLTNIQHPIIFVALIMMDVCENMFCLWSLCRVAASKTSKIVPESEPPSISTSHTTANAKSLVKRSSSVFSLINDMRDDDTENNEGTTLFIAATLLQRELVETLTPIQSIIVMSIIYLADVKSNSMVLSWQSREDYSDAVIFMVIDCLVEVFIFAFTVVVLGRIYPKFSAWRILMGLVRENSFYMFAITINIWLTILLFQNTLTGVDLTFKFEWLRCNGENATWVKGFDWDGC
jgi:hypothetical protein